MVKMVRKQTKVVKVGNLLIGGNNPIIIQSMTNTKTKDVDATVAQINKLTQAGCQLIRVSVLDFEDAKAISEIKKNKLRFRLLRIYILTIEWH